MSEACGLAPEAEPRPARSQQRGPWEFESVVGVARPWSRTGFRVGSSRVSGDFEFGGRRAAFGPIGPIPPAIAGLA